jgi:hypothetical protein
MSQGLPLMLPSQAFFDFFIGLHLQLSPHLHSGPHGQFLPSLQAATDTFVSQALVLFISPLQHGPANANDAATVSVSRSFFNIQFP